MSQRKEVLNQMLDTTLEIFTKSLLESQDLWKMSSHRKLNMDKAAVDAVMARMAKSTQQKVLEKTDQMIKENSVYELFDDMEQLTRESEELNKQLGREMGYNPVNAKRDVALHLSETAEKMLTEADAEIEKIEKELKAEEDEIARRKQVLKELATIVESQQQKL